MNIDFFKYSNNGERAVNEDSVGFYTHNDLYVFALCDGLGGHGRGEIASQTAVEAMLNEAAACVYDAEMISKCFEKANVCVLEKQTENALNKDMKTTGTLLIINKDNACWGHIGDSRIYYFHKNKYIKRTLDHSIPQMLVSTGEIRERDIRHHEDRNRLLRCIPWNNKKYEIDEVGFKLKAEDCFLIMSDGFWDWVDEKTMKKCIKKGKSAEDTGVLLIKEAFDKGRGNNMDNLSLIVVKIN